MQCKPNLNLTLKSGFKPRENTPDARRRRKSIQKGRNRYHSMSFRYKKQTQNFEMSLEKMMVAVKTLKGKNKTKTIVREIPMSFSKSLLSSGLV